MDPFNDVQTDARSQLASLGAFLDINSVKADHRLDFDNALLELQETLQDLQDAIDICESNPKQFNLSESDIAERKSIISQLKSDLSGTIAKWNQKVSKREVTTMSNRISQDDSRIAENPFNDSERLNSEFQQFQEQEMVQNQDMQLDSIHVTMHNLNQQAMQMGQELEEQGFMLDDLDQEMDNVDSKLQRGMKRINYVIEKNRERASDCCIVLLAIALVVLLVILIAA